MLDLSGCSENFKHRFQQRQSLRLRNRNVKSPEWRQNLHVGVIGAGLAGLRCADILIEEGINVTILEARDRLGGRIHQSSLAGQLVDMGPNWIHGTDENPILKLAEDTNSPLICPNESTRIYDSDGTLMNSQKVSEGFRIVWDILTDAFKHSNKNFTDIAPNISLKTFFQEKLRMSILDEGAKSAVLKLAEMWGGFIGDPFEKQSLKWVWLEECLDGDNLFLSNTYQAIINRVAEPAVSHAQIFLSTVVQCIESHAENAEDRRVTVTTANGNFSFDEVVVTVPLGCLKMGNLKFLPEIPSHISRAIACASYSRLEKALLAFPMAFWEKSDPRTIYNEQVTRDTEHVFPTFTHFLRPTYVPEEQRSWTLEMMALSSPTVFGGHAQPVLQFYLWGTAGAHMASAITNLAPSSKEYYKAISTLLRPFYSRLPNYRTDCSECVPTAAVATKWQEDEFAGKGSYTNFKIHEGGTQTGSDLMIDDGVRAMRHGMPERGVWFAGEHTAPFVALGTSTGAYWSGEAVATRIIEAHDCSIY